MPTGVNTFLPGLVDGHEDRPSVPGQTGQRADQVTGREGVQA